MKAYLNDADGLEVANYSYKEAGEDLHYVIVGETRDVTGIKYHAPEGSGDRHFVDVYMNGNLAYRDFQVETIAFKLPREVNQ